MHKINILYQAYCIFILKLNKNMKKKIWRRNVRRRTDHASKRWSRTVGVEPSASKRPASENGKIYASI